MKTIQMLDLLEQQGVPLEQLKKDYMLLNQIGLKSDTKIYRVFSFERFLNAINNKKLTLVKPKLWQDPFENFLLKSQGMLPDGSIAHFDAMRELYYGQCWSLRKECDGLWKTYSPNHMGIKARTTVSKLFDEFYDIGNPFHTLCYFIGNVKYVPDSKFKTFLNPKYIFTSDGKGIIETLLIKRKAFDYEKEVRIIFKVPNDESEDYSKVRNKWSQKSDFFDFCINPNTLFEQVEFNPFISEALYKILSDGLVNSGYKGKIKKSKLHDEPKYTIKI